MKEGAQYLSWSDQNVTEQLCVYLERDQVVVGSSDTVLGLLANVTETAFIELNQLKARSEKPYIILISDIDKLSHFIDQQLSPDVLNLLNFCWPGPLTMIFQAKNSLASFMTSSDCKIALRVPQHDELRNLLVHFKGLFSTSANLTGQPVPNLIENVDGQILAAVAGIVLGQDRGSTLPSTILDCSSGRIKVIRAGAYSIDSLQRLCQDQFEK